ncbi:MAG: SMP-30/gluconolactonase/LRE family protein [Pseudomonadota bacterium]
MNHPNFPEGSSPGQAAIDLSSLTFHGHGLKRPECVLAHQSGLLFTADWTGPGGVAIIDPQSGGVHRLLARDPHANLKPNGIWLEEGGSFLIARLDDTEGGVFRLYPDGRHEAVLTEVDGAPLPPTNFVVKDRHGRLYVTVSTRAVPRHHAAKGDGGDGFIVLVPQDGPARIVADGLGYTNECLVSADGAHLTVNETFARVTSRYKIADDGSLSDRTILARYGEGIYPDGLTPDQDGGLWITSIISNTVLRLAPDGSVTTMMEDRDAERVARVEAAYQNGALDRALLDAPHNGPLKNVSSLAFGGKGMKTAYLGCLLGDSIATAPSPFKGAEPCHYRMPLDPLVDAGVIPAAWASPERMS